MTAFLEENNILSEKQSGFRKGFSTASAVADLTDNLFQAINNDEVTKAVFLDFRKAFDTVSHKILCKKLEKYGIRNGILDWCVNYLANRSQMTLANDVRSETVQLNYGVPRGSVLGPLFFILYVNDLQHVLVNANVQLYADDTVMFISGSVSSESLTNYLQRDLNRLHKWCQSNKLTLNPSKTKVVTFGTRQALKKVKPNPLYLGNDKISSVTSYKYLGFTIDSTLTFRPHIADVMKKVMHKRTMLSKLMPFLNRNVAISIYKMMILPYFDYCDVVYQSACSNDLEKLQRLQNKCL